jgi:hypothetical protein
MACGTIFSNESSDDSSAAALDLSVCHGLVTFFPSGNTRNVVMPALTLVTAIFDLLVYVRLPEVQVGEFLCKV